MASQLFEVGQWISGPEFAKFLTEHGVENNELASDCRSTSYIQRWERGEENLSVTRADKFLTRLGYHLWELPDSAWILNYKPYGDSTRKINDAYFSFS